MTPMLAEDEERIYRVAEAILEEAEATALSYFRKDLVVDMKGDLSPVTVADRDIEMKARRILKTEFPSHDIVGEEFESSTSNPDHLWIIDPIDGTRSFISGSPLFGFLLSYRVRGQSQFSAISMPALGERFVARAHRCATLNGADISVSTTKELSDAILYVNEGEKIFAKEPDVFRRLLKAPQTLRFAYDCYPHALLAAGLVDAVVDYDLKPFDFLPVAGLVEAAGGVITDWTGQPLSMTSDGRVVTAATPELHAELLKSLAPHDALSDTTAPASLIRANDGPPVDVINPGRQGGILLVCEHASNRIPESLNHLGLSAEQQISHVAWDPGAMELAEAISGTLDATLVAARFSRLVYDCNRPPDVPSAVPIKTEAFDVPGNEKISVEERSARVQGIYEPFHDKIAELMRELQPKALVTIHSFTKVYCGQQRDVQIGLLCGDDQELADQLLQSLRAVSGLKIEKNQPYGPDDGVLHTLLRHGASNGMPHVMIEVRNDLLAPDADVQEIHDLLASCLQDVLEGAIAT